MPTLFLHIGAHRTATTSLQELLLKCNKALLKSRIRYLQKDQSASHPFYPLVQAGHGRLSSEALRKLGEKAYHSAKALQKESAGCDLLLSDENFSGRMLGLDRALYPFSDQICRVAQFAFSAYNVRPIIVLRRQDDYLASAYLFRVLRGYQGTVCEFLELVDLSKLSWRQLIQPWELAFGRDNTRIVLFEQLVSKDLSAKAISSMLLGLSINSNAKLPHRNASASPLLAAVVQELRARGISISEAVLTRLQTICRASIEKNTATTEGQLNSMLSVLSDRRLTTVANLTEYEAMASDLRRIEWDKRICERTLPSGVRNLIRGHYRCENLNICRRYNIDATRFGCCSLQST